jgi:hypothetical protein
VINQNEVSIIFIHTSFANELCRGWGTSAIVYLNWRKLSFHSILVNSSAIYLQHTYYQLFWLVRYKASSSTWCQVLIKVIFVLTCFILSAITCSRVFAPIPPPIGCLALAHYYCILLIPVLPPPYTTPYFSLLQIQITPQPLKTPFLTVGSIFPPLSHPLLSCTLPPCKLCIQPIPTPLCLLQTHTLL